MFMEGTVSQKQGKDSRKRVKVIFDGHVFRPEEPVDFEPDTRYTAVLTKDEKETVSVAFQKILERAEDLEISDLSRQHDHYLYGTEKR